MTNENNTRKKASTVFFAAVMVTSMVAIGFAAGLAAALDTSGESDFDATDYDRVLEAGETVYEGHLALVNFTDFTTADDSEFRHADSGDIGALVSSPTMLNDPNDDRFAILNTANPDADQCIVTEYPCGDEIKDTNGDIAFELVVQDLDVSFGAATANKEMKPT